MQNRTSLIVRSVAVVATYFALSGCGGGGGTAPQALSQGGAGAAAMTMSFLIPSAPTTSSTRRAAYVSASTASVAVIVAPGGTQPSLTTTANLGPNQPGCTATASGTTCLVTVQAPLGTDTVTVIAYSAANGTGSVLAQATFTQSVTAGMSPVGVTLNGVLAQVRLSLQTPALSSGTSATSILNVNGYDASGNLIAAPGTFSAPITITSDSTSVALSGTSITGPGQAITVTYAGGSAPYTIHFSATSSGVAANFIVGATLAIVPTQGFAIAGFGNGASPYTASYATNALNDPPLSFSTVAPFGANSTYRFATSPTGGYALATLGTANSTCTLQLYSVAGAPVGSPFTYLSQPVGSQLCAFTFDTAAGSIGDLIVFDNSSPGVGELNEYSVSAAGIGSSVRTIALQGNVAAPLRIPGVLAVDGSGTIYVSSNGGANVARFTSGQSGVVAPASSATLSNPIVDIAFTSTGTVYLESIFTPFASWQVQAYSGGVLQGTFTYPGQNVQFQTPTGIAVDAAGEILVGSTLVPNTGNGNEFVVLAFPAGSTGSATPTRTFGGSVTRVEQNTVAGPRILSTALSVPAAATATVSGDMLAYAPSRAWTYQTTQGGTTNYFGIYADPQVTNGVETLVLFCTINNQTGCTSPNPFVAGTSLAAIGVQQQPSGYLWTRSLPVRTTYQESSQGRHFSFQTRCS